MSVDTQTPSTASSATRVLPARIAIPPIRGEMLRLVPARQDDLALLNEIDAYYNASMITGKDQQSERAMVQAWVARSQAWSQGRSSHSHGAFDAQSRGTIAWSIVTNAGEEAVEDSDVEAARGSVPTVQHDVGKHEHQLPITNYDNKPPLNGVKPAHPETEDGYKVIGMIFLIDIDPWANSARIQVILGRDYRGRGYSRDAMPRVMTYGFAPEPVGLNLHRIWVAVPSINTRSLSVYTSLGFVQSGAARDAMWDEISGKYQDLIVMDSLADEYDPLGSLEAFGMQVFEENPGVAQALTARMPDAISPGLRCPPEFRGNMQDESDMVDASVHEAPGATGVWPATPAEAKHSQQAWWRNLGRGTKSDNDAAVEGEEQES